MRLYLIILCLCFSILSMGMTFAPTKNNLHYNNLALGDNYEDMIAQFGTPRYDEQNYLWSKKITYYVYKNNNKIRSAARLNDIIMNSIGKEDTRKVGFTVTYRFRTEQVRAFSIRRF